MPPRHSDDMTSTDAEAWQPVQAAADASFCAAEQPVVHLTMCSTAHTTRCATPRQLPAAVNQAASMAAAAPAVSMSSMFCSSYWLHTLMSSSSNSAFCRLMRSSTFSLISCRAPASMQEGRQACVLPHVRCMMLTCKACGHVGNTAEHPHGGCSKMLPASPRASANKLAWHPNRARKCALVHLRQRVNPRQRLSLSTAAHSSATAQSARSAASSTSSAAAARRALARLAVTERAAASIPACCCSSCCVAAACQASWRLVCQARLEGLHLRLHSSISAQASRLSAAQHRMPARNIISHDAWPLP